MSVCIRPNEHTVGPKAYTREERIRLEETESKETGKEAITAVLAHTDFVFIS